MAADPNRTRMAKKRDEPSKARRGLHGDREARDSTARGPFEEPDELCAAARSGDRGLPRSLRVLRGDGSGRRADDQRPGSVRHGHREPPHSGAALRSHREERRGHSELHSQAALLHVTPGVREPPWAEECSRLREQSVRSDHASGGGEPRSVLCAFIAEWRIPRRRGSLRRGSIPNRPTPFAGVGWRSSRRTTATIATTRSSRHSGGRRLSRATGPD